MIDQIDVHHDDRARLQEAIETAFKLSGGMVKIIVGEQEYMYSSHRMCLRCAESMPELEPRFFSFNSPIGACEHCHGIGIIHEWPWEEG